MPRTRAWTLGWLCVVATMLATAGCSEPTTPSYPKITAENLAKLCIDKVTEDVSMGVPRTVCFSADGALLATGGGDQGDIPFFGSQREFSGDIKIWDSKTGKRIKTLEMSSRVISATFHPDGKLLAASTPYFPYLWDWKAGRKLDMPIHLRGEIMESDMGIFSPDGRLLVARTGTQIRSWDTATWTEQGVLPEEKEIRIVRFFFIDSSTLWIGGYDLPARLCDSASLRVRTELKMSEWPSGAALSPDRTLLAIAEVNTIELWSTSEWALLKRLGPTKERILGLAFSPKGTTIAAVGFEPGRARAPSVLMLWRVDESKE